MSTSVQVTITWPWVPSFYPSTFIPLQHWSGHTYQILYISVWRTLNLLWVLISGNKKSDSTKVLSDSCFSYLPLALCIFVMEKSKQCFCNVLGNGQVSAPREPEAELGMARLLTRYNPNQPNLAYSIVLTFDLNYQIGKACLFFLQNQHMCWIEVVK